MVGETVRLDSVFVRKDNLTSLSQLLLLEYTQWQALGRRIKPSSKAEVRRMNAAKFPVHLFSYEQTMAAN